MPDLDNYRPLGDIYGCQCMGHIVIIANSVFTVHENGKVLLPSSPITYKKYYGTSGGLVIE